MPTDRRLSTKPLLSVEDTAILLGQSRSSIYRAIDRGDLPLPVFTINGRWRVPRRASSGCSTETCGQTGAGRSQRQAQITRCRRRRVARWRSQRNVEVL